MTVVLRPVLFMNAQTSAGTYPSTGAIPIDFKYYEERLRSIVGTRTDTGDIITVLLETVVPQFGLDGTLISSVIVTATATVFTSALGTSFGCIIEGPFSRIKVQKTGAAGAATVVGIL